MKLFILLILAFLPSALWAFEVFRFDTQYFNLQQHDEHLLGVNENGAAHILRFHQGNLQTEGFSVNPLPERPADILADGRVVGSNGKIRQAWLGGPSDRYRHGVMADDIEATRLYAELVTQQTVFLELPAHMVFEDRFPRLVDLDNDNEMELVVIRTDVDRGAGIAVYGLRGDELVLEAASNTIGTPNRWLNIVGIEDFNGDHVREIAAVITPHIGGKLTLFQQQGEKLVPIAMQAGYSNHAYGSRELGMSAALDINADGIMDLAVPDAQREDLIFLTARDDQFDQVRKISNHTVIKSGIYPVQLDSDEPLEVVYLLEDNTLKVVDLE